jgi:hypothetical protein
MTEYFVRWTVEIDANSAEEAAKIAREFQLDPNSVATVFNVSTNEDDGVYIDVGQVLPKRD